MTANLDNSARNSVDSIYAYIHVDYAHNGKSVNCRTLHLVSLKILLAQTLGYQRTLQATDLWRLDPSRESGLLGDKLDQAWARRVQAAEDWNTRLAKGEIRPPFIKRVKWSIQALKSNGAGYAEKRAALEQNWLNHDGRKEASLAWALNDTFGLSFWLGGLFKVSVNTLAHILFHDMHVIFRLREILHN
jgi:hypothetical protein